MKHFVRFEAEGKIDYGLLQGEDIQALDGDIFTDYKEAKKTFKLKEVKLLAPCLPSKAICVGLNYRNHAAELTMKVPEEPILFLKPPSSVIAVNEDIVYWPSVRQLDYEAELVVVIGKKAHNVEEKDALDFVFGYTAGNDITARNLQKKDGQWTVCKGFDTFLALGPSIVTGLDPADISVRSFLNGQMKQDGRTSNLIFSVPYLVSYISKVMTLLPGDIIMSGTPEGVGPMQIGDSIEVKVEHIGSLINKVVAP